MIPGKDLRAAKTEGDALEKDVGEALAVRPPEGKLIPLFTCVEVLVDTQRSGVFDEKQSTWLNTAQDVFFEEFAPYVRSYDNPYSVGAGANIFNGFTTSVMASNMSMLMYTNVTPGNLGPASPSRVAVDFQWNVFRSPAFNNLLPQTQQSTLLSRNAMGFYGRDQSLRFARGLKVLAGEGLTARIRPTLCVTLPSPESDQIRQGPPPRFLVFGIAMAGWRNAQRAWPTVRPVEGVLR